MDDINQTLFFSQVDIKLSTGIGSNDDSFSLTSSSDKNMNNDKGGMYFESLTHTKRVVSGDLAGNLKLVVVDNTSTGLEQKLIKNRYLILKYKGISEDKNGQKRETTHGPINFQIQNWHTELTPYGAKITIDAISVGGGLVQKSLPTTKEDKNYHDPFYEGPPHKAIEEVCKQLGLATTYKGKSTIIETKPCNVPNIEGGDEKSPTEKKYQYKGGYAINFINEIAASAEPKDNKYKMNYHFFISPFLENNKPVAVFAPKDCVIDGLSEKKEVVFEYNNKNSFVQSWRPVFEGKNMLAINGIECVFVEDGKTNTVLAENSADSESTDKNYLRITCSATKAQAQTLANILLKARQYSSHKATISLVNYTDVKINDQITVIAITKEGFVHHTSGIFLVTSVTDNISGGMITTSLELIHMPGSSLSDEVKSKYNLKQ